MASAAGAGQSPNTGSIVVVVVDQSGAVVKDAKVTVTNTATGAVREASVERGRVGHDADALADGDLQGQRDEGRVHGGRRAGTRPPCGRDRDREGETRGERRSERRHRLRHHGGSPGRCPARQAHRRRDHRRDADSRPEADHVAALQLRVPPGQGHRRLVRQRHLLCDRGRQPPHRHLHARRREQRRGLGPPDHARQRAGRRRPGSHRAVERVLRRVPASRPARR